MKQILLYFLYQFDRLKEAFGSPGVTVQYPYVHKKLSLLAKTSLRLDITECTGCLKCKEVCPVDAISIDTKELVDQIILPTSSNGCLFERKVLQMNVDYGRCIFCGICIERCEPEALSLSRDLPPVETKASGLIDNLVKTKELPKTTWGENP